MQEQEASARIGGYEFELLKLPDGQPPREACLQVTSGLLAALWEAIRRFEPDYLFCPPLPADPLAGIHVDHVAVAEAVRQVAYMINVPHAFTPEYPADETRSAPCKVPVIINVYDSYMAGANACDIAVDVEPAFQKICEMSWCHQSQITEWLPWVGRHDMAPPKNFRGMVANNCAAVLRTKIASSALPSARRAGIVQRHRLGCRSALRTNPQRFPNILPEASNLDALRERLAKF